MRSAEVQYTYDEALARAASFRFLSRYARGLFFIVAVLVIAAALFAMQGDYTVSWISGAVVVAILLALLRYRRRAVTLARRLETPRIDVIADEESITFRMNGNHSRSEWSKHRVLWRFDDVWLFLPYGSSSSYTGVPTSAMSDEFRQIVVDGIAAHGGKVV